MRQRGRRFNVFCIMQIFWLTQTDSTNSHAKRMNAHGVYAPPFWVIADTQTQGYGTQNRPWHSRKGNFSGTLSFYSTQSGPAFARLAFLTAQSICQSMEKFSIPLQVKPPNDIIVSTPAGPLKIGGVLVEIEGQTLYIGVGFNLVWAPLSHDLAAHKNEKKVTLPATSLREHLGLFITPQDFFSIFQEHLFRNLSIWDHTNKLTVNYEQN